MDISLGGLRCTTSSARSGNPHTVLVGAVLDLAITATGLPAVTDQIRARVAWTKTLDGGRELGLEFLHLPPGYRPWITGLANRDVDHHGGRPGPTQRN